MGLEAEAADKKTFPDTKDASGDELDQTVPMGPDLQLEAAVALGILFLHFPWDV